ncbi:MAG: extracellular solute-binding protein [Clostridiales bacterium]|nr:extracellular solute-binding protein [Clostridiales bacterium]
MKRATIILLSLVMLLSVVTACTGNATTSTTGQSGSTTTVDRSKITINYLANANVQSFKDGEDENNNEFINWLKEKSGYNLVYQILPSEGAEQKRALIMASPDLPDLMALGRGTYLDYVSKNYLTDLTEAIEKTPELKATKCFDEEVYNMSLVDGKPFAICTPSNGSPAPDALCVDYEVAEELGIDVKKPDMSLESIMDMFARAKAAFPDLITYTGAGKGTSYYKLADFRWLYAAYDVDTTWRVKADGTLEYCATTQDMYDCLAFIREMFDKGYLDPGYATVDNPILQERMANRSAAFLGASWYDWPGDSAVTNVDPNTAIFPILGQAVGKDGMTGQDLESTVLNYIVVPRGSDVVEHCMNYLVTLTSDEAYEFLFYGEEGKQFEFDAQGKRIPLDDPENTRKKIGLQYYVYYYIYEDMAQRTERLGFMSIGDQVRIDRHQIYGLDMKTKLNPAYNMPSIDIVNEGMPDINACCAEWFLKIATGAAGLDEGWNGFLAEFKSLGGEDIVKAVSDWYVGQ